MDPQSEADAELRTGASLTLIGLRGQPDLSTGSAHADLFQGCHEYEPFDPQVAFGGTGTFRATQPAGAFSGSLGGGGTGGTGGASGMGLDAIASAPATIPVPVGGLVPVTIVAGRLVVQEVSATGLMRGKVCGGIREQDINGVLVHQIAGLMRAQVALGGSTAQTLCQVFDTMVPTCAPTAADCANLGPTNPPPAGCLSDLEIQENPIIKSVLKPDVTIGGVRLLSVGLGLTAVRAQF